ncbi:MAG: sugar ABC transporter permease [Chloroflexi bacterium]|nr:MAG: sugar ABC transporter permease [Chloroflexota bacterium]
MTVFDEARSLAGRKETFQRPRSKLEKQRARWGWIFLSPWIIGFLIFTMLPMLASLAFSFTDFNITKPDEMTFIGIDNYARLFSDPDLGQALKVTFIFFALAIPLGIVQPIAMASLLNLKQLIGKRFFTTFFYMPYMVPVVSAIIIWRGVMNPQTGWINRSLAFIGINGPDWLNSTTWVYPALLIIGLWSAGNAMLFTLIGLQNVPTEIYDAAKVDGANGWRQFWHITIPMITPVIFYNLVMAVIGLFQYFTIPWILTRASTQDPGQSQYFFNIHFYKTAFTYQDMGYGATLAWLLFFIAMSLTIFVFWSAKYWVYSPGGTD